MKISVNFTENLMKFGFSFYEGTVDGGGNSKAMMITYVVQVE